MFILRNRYKNEDESICFCNVFKKFIKALICTPWFKFVLTDTSEYSWKMKFYVIFFDYDK